MENKTLRRDPSLMRRAVATLARKTAVTPIRRRGLKRLMDKLSAIR